MRLASFSQPGGELSPDLCPHPRPTVTATWKKLTRVLMNVGKNGTFSASQERGGMGYLMGSGLHRKANGNRGTSRLAEACRDASHRGKTRGKAGER